MRWLPVVWGGAIAAGAAGGVSWGASDLWLQIALLVTFACGVHGVWRGRARLVLAGCVVGLAAASWALAAHADAAARQPPLLRLLDRGPDPVWVEGVLAEDASPGGAGIRLELRVDTARVALTVGGSLAAEAMPQWRAGRRLRMPATLRRPGRFLDGGVPDHQLIQARRGLVLVGTVKSGALVEVVAHGSWFAERAADVRAYARRAIAARVGGDPQSAATARAILIGDRSGLEPEAVERLQAAGTYHVMAISGGNIALLAGGLLGLLWLARVSERPRALAAIALLAGYAVLVGAEPSVVRATTMAAAYLALRTVDLRAAPINALGASAGAMIVASPLSICDAGFLLTFAATGALVLLTGRFLPATKSRVMRWLLGPIAASIAAELLLLPISAAQFNRVTGAGLILNLAAVPLMAVVQFSSLLVVITHDLLPPVAAAAGWMAAHAAEWLIRSAGLVELAPWLSRRVPAPAMWCTALYFIALTVVFVAPHLHSVPGRWRVAARRWCACLAGVMAVWIVVHPSTWRWPWRADGLLRVTVLDVGQGDAILIECPNGARFLIDAGGFAAPAVFDVGARVVAPALWARGVSSLDALVVTHGDPDHVGGAPAVLEDFAPREVWEGVPVPSHAPLARLRSQAARTGASWRTVQDGTSWSDGAVQLRVWHPPVPDWERPRVRNDDSVVIELRMGDVSIVLPGDIGGDVERDLASRLPPAPLRVLKAPHHGSATSSSDAFLDALRPAFVLVSCGRENRYGHPAAAVLARYAERDIRVLRTDVHGAITLETDGRTVRAGTFVGERLEVAAGAKTQRHKGTKARRE